ncbi:MAG: acylneuraminate cytidylyltransferase family protein [Candidatus Lindowbacteria bacterium]|nr:acylneuraminate cytidylyltransferase family protein [Candidatus Lindowbacteria bacterium]
MIDSKNVLPLIPARGGSKELPGKNILEICGKPLIAWSINAAKESQYIDQVIVNTDSEEIAEIAKSFGAEVPFMRPTELALDDSLIRDSILDVLNKLETKPDILCLLQPTSPLRTSLDIDAALCLIVEKNGDAVVSMTEVVSPDYDTGILSNDLCIEGFLSVNEHLNRDDAGKYAQINGALYISTVENFEKTQSWFTGKSHAFLMDKSRSIDIDDETDFICAEALLQKQQ